MFKSLVRVFHHHDGSVDHRADGNGDPTERHYVGSEIEIIDRNKRQNDRNRKRDDDDQRATHVEKKNDDDKTNN